MDGQGFIYLKAILGLLFVIGLIFLSAALVRKTGLDKRLTGGHNRKKRLSVEETMYLDAKTRLVLVACEGKEHLLLVSASGNMLIETRESGDHA